MYESLLLLFGFGLCHQLPERSLFGGGVQAPVCARDTGIYLGIVLSLLIVAALQRRPSELPSVGVGILLAGFVSVMALDGITSYAGLRETTNEIRLATGLLAGYAIGALVAPLINDQLWRTRSPERVLGTPRSLGLWLASIPVAYALAWWGGGLLGSAYPLVVALAILGSLVAVNLLIVTLLPRFERRADRLVQAWLPLVLAFVLAWFEVLVSAGLKGWLAALLS